MEKRITDEDIAKFFTGPTISAEVEKGLIVVKRKKKTKDDKDFVITTINPEHFK